MFLRFYISMMFGLLGIKTFHNLKKFITGTSLVVQYLSLCASNAGGTSWGTKILRAFQHSQKDKIRSK